METVFQEVPGTRQNLSALQLALQRQSDARADSQRRHSLQHGAH